jgi:hypothetical protein
VVLVREGQINKSKASSTRIDKGLGGYCIYSALEAEVDLLRGFRTVYA